MSSTCAPSGSPALEAYRRLMEAYGPQGWWPGASAMEVCVGAVLTQNTSWVQVEKALQSLEEGRLLHDPAALLSEPVSGLQERIRPAGSYRRKTTTLRRLASFLVEECAGDPRTLRDWETKQARTSLLELPGIGPETADAILLYAAGHAQFVVDAYSRRVSERHGWAHERDGYEAVRSAFTDGLPRDEKIYNEYHALLVRVGKDHCLKSAPSCEGCPLEPLLPEEG